MNDRWLETGRIQQKRRTRRELLEAAAQLMKEGKTPTVAEAAKLASVSRATAYRYFPTQESLLNEAPLELNIPPAEDIFAADDPADPEDRVDVLERAIHATTFRNEANIRMFFRISMDRWFARAKGSAQVPLRQGRRMQLIEAALKPARGELDGKTYKTLSAALAMIVGIESMIALTDVVQLSPREARQVKSWAVRALVRAARAEARPSKRGTRAMAQKPRRRK